MSDQPTTDEILATASLAAAGMQATQPHIQVNKVAMHTLRQNVSLLLAALRARCTADGPATVAPFIERINTTLLAIQRFVDKLAAMSLLRQLLKSPAVAVKAVAFNSELGELAHGMRLKGFDVEASKMDKAVALDEGILPSVINSLAAQTTGLAESIEALVDIELCMDGDLAPFPPETHTTLTQVFNTRMEATVAHAGRDIWVDEPWIINDDDTDVFLNRPLGTAVPDSVFAGLYRGQPVALKFLRGATGDDAAEAIDADVQQWYGIDHPHVLKLHGACINADKPFVVVDLLDTDLARHLRRHRDVALETRAAYLVAVAKGVAALHRQTPAAVVHGDLRAKNVLVGQDSRVVVYGFGLKTVKAVCRGSESMYSPSTRWSAPETYAPGYVLHPAADAFSFAMLCVEVLTGAVPFANQPSNDVVKELIAKGTRAPRPDGVPDALWRIVEDCWRADPAQRPTFDSIVQQLDAVFTPAKQAKPAKPTKSKKSKKPAAVSNAAAVPAAAPAAATPTAPASPASPAAKPLFGASPASPVAKPLFGAAPAAVPAAKPLFGAAPTAVPAAKPLFGAVLPNTPPAPPVSVQAAAPTPATRPAGRADDPTDLEILIGAFPIWAKKQGVTKTTREHPMFTLENGRLKELRLKSCDLTGEIPKDICRLRELTTLDLSFNRLTGEIPSEIGNLTNLAILTLNNNGLYGKIPPSICSLEGIVLLALNNNQLTGPIPANIGNLVDANIVLLSENQLSGQIPPSFGNMTELKGLGLNNNKLTGSIPATLGNLPELLKLALGDNNLTGPIPQELSRLTKLVYFQVQGNMLTGSVPAALSRCVALKDLAVIGNRLNGSIAKELMTLRNLEGLSLANNSLTGGIPVQIGNLASLKQLYLTSNALTGSLPPTLANLRQLKKLMVENNRLTGPIPKELGLLTGLTELRLMNNKLTGSIPAEIGNMASLTVLDLSKNQLTGSMPTSLGRLARLTELILSDNQLNASIPAELGQLKELRSLALMNNQLKGPIPAALGNLGNLLHLHVENNQLTGSIPRELGRLANLTVMRLDSNRLTGPIPREIDCPVGSSAGDLPGRQPPHGRAVC
ncbi:hypothetical protein BC831DRAFT_250202 [Entophlyctis helioformis]|nr:hypothetical protein BC831DRAFT_250202 [Entophlyctis helioformis]